MNIWRLGQSTVLELQVLGLLFDQTSDINLGEMARELHSDPWMVAAALADLEIRGLRRRGVA